MKKSYIAVICVMVCLFAFVGFTRPSAMENDIITVVETVDKTVFFDEAVASVEGSAPTAEHLWMLPNGNYAVTFHNGHATTLVVEDGSWFYMS